MAVKRSYLSEVKSVWIESFSDKRFRNRFWAVLLFISVVLFFLTRFLTFNENRDGFRFADPFLILFDPVDVTWLTFVLIYAAIVIAVFYLTRHPDYFLVALLAYALTASFRMLAMYSLPLDPPATIIPLVDPFVEFFGGGSTLEKDLFFSGHTSTMFLLFLTAKQPVIKNIFFALTVLVGLCVLIQHVHYSVDVIIAPFVAYSSYRIALSFIK